MANWWAEKCKDPRWQRLRLELMEGSNWLCNECGRADSMLAVHHLYYVANRAPWEYPEESLLVLCEECHAKQHARGGLPDAKTMAASVMDALYRRLGRGGAEEIIGGLLGLAWFSENTEIPPFAPPLSRKGFSILMDNVAPVLSRAFAEDMAEIEIAVSHVKSNWMDK